MKMLQKKFIIPTIIIAVLLLIIILVSSGGEKTKETISTAKIDSVVEKISETGIVKKGDKLEIGFEISGIIKGVPSKIGQAVKRGDILGKLDNSQLIIQYNQALSDYNLTKSQLDKINVGATAQDIQMAQTTATKAQKSWEASKESLINTQQVSIQTLNSYYSLSLSHLQATKIQIFDALTFLEEMQRDYFYIGDQISINVREKIAEAKIIHSYLDTVIKELNETFSQTKADEYLGASKNKIYIFTTILDFVKEKAWEGGYKDTVTSADKTILDTHRGYISAAYSTIVSDISTIALKKSIEDQTSATAKAAVDQAYYAYQGAQEALDKLKTIARVEDIAYYQAQVDKAQDSVKYLENQISKATAKSPVDGMVVEIKKSVGELTQALTPVFYILPDTTYYVEADIYEEDVPKIKIGDKTEIELVAYPQEVFQGEVFFIEPGEKIVNDVVYYPVKIIFNLPPTIEIKSGMSADVSITTRQIDNVLTVSIEAINNIDGKTFVFVKRNNQTRQQEVEVGLSGTNGLVEIKKGLADQETIVIK
jgi:RND family efflux transporter MFP subunit